MTNPPYTRFDNSSRAGPGHLGLSGAVLDERVLIGRHPSRAGLDGPEVVVEVLVVSHRPS